MFGSQEWSGVSGVVTLEICRVLDDNDKPVQPEVWVEVGKEKPLPQILVDEIKSFFPAQYEVEQAWFEVCIEFESSGYYAPAKIHGLPENCYPEEGGDERTVDRVMIYAESESCYDEKNGKMASKNVMDKLEGLYYDEIYAVELESDNDGYED